MSREYFIKADPCMTSGCCCAPMDSWIEGREHHVVCSVCGVHSVFFKRLDGRIVRTVVEVAA